MLAAVLATMASFEILRDVVVGVLERALADPELSPQLDAIAAAAAPIDAHALLSLCLERVGRDEGRARAAQEAERRAAKAAAKEHAKVVAREKAAAEAALKQAAAREAASEAEARRVAKEEKAAAEAALREAAAKEAALEEARLEAERAEAQAQAAVEAAARERQVAAEAAAERARQVAQAEARKLAAREEKQAEKAEDDARKAAAREAAAADAAMARAKAEAEARTRAEERAAKEAADAAALAAEAKRRADEAAAAAEEVQAAATAEAAAFQNVESDEQRRAAEAAASRAEKVSREAQKAEGRWRKAEEKALRAAEKHAERSREKAAAALQVAKAAAARVNDLNAAADPRNAVSRGRPVGGGASAAEPPGSAMSIAHEIAQERLRRRSAGTGRLVGPVGRGAIGGLGVSTDLDHTGVGILGGAAAGEEQQAPPREKPIEIRYADPNALEECDTAADALALERRMSLEQGASLGAIGTFGERIDSDDDDCSARDEQGGEAGATPSDDPEWVEMWRRGGLRGAEMVAYTNMQCDCLAMDGGDTLVCVGGDGGGDGLVVSVYSALSGSVLLNLRGHTEQVVSVACEGDLVASGSRDKTIRLWSRAIAECLATLSGCAGAVYGLALSGETLFSAEGSAEIAGVAKARLWSVRSHACVCTYDEHRGNIWSAALAEMPSGLLALTASRDCTARVWPAHGVAATGSSNKPGGRRASLATLKHPKLVSSVSARGGLAVTGCHDALIRIWSLTNYTCLHTLDHGSGSALGWRKQQSFGDRGVSGVSWISTRLLGGGALLSGGEAGHVKLWQLKQDATAEPECLATLAHGQAVRGITGSPLTGVVVSAGGRSGAGLVVWYPNPLESVVLGGTDPSASDAAESAAPAGAASAQSASLTVDEAQHAGHDEPEPLAAPTPALPAHRRTFTRRMSSLF